MRTTFEGQSTNEISFPLGGIGTGSVGLAGNGRLIDWEIFGKANKGSVNGHTHFAVKAERGGRLIDARVVCGDIYKNLAGQTGLDFGTGLTNTSMQGFPHFRSCEFTGEFPLASLDLSDPDAAMSVKLSAFNPFIPHNSKDSSIPAAFFELEVTNTTAGALDFSVAASLANPSEKSLNRFFDDGFKGISLGNPDDNSGLALSTDASDISYQENWYRGGWFDHLETYWRNFTETRRFGNRHYDEPGKRDTATLCAHKRLEPNESFRVRFVLAWYYPVKPDQWKWGGESEVEVRNYYSFLFDSAKSAALFSLSEWDRLYRATKRWHDELFASTLPEDVVEAVSANCSVLKTETSIRVGEKGDFYGWEGLYEKAGSCPGTCTHVWNYAYVMPYLFPDLERGIRENDYRYNQTENGGMVFRTRLPFGRGGKPTSAWFRPCADGQFGGIIKTWREWKLSGDTEWLRSLWTEVKASLEYAWSDKNPDRWDENRDGVLEGRQHHTLDMELFGPSSWLEGFYLGALKAAAEMADALGDPDGDKYRELFERGKKWTAENLFNGRHFIQKIDLTDKSLIDRFGADNYWNSEAGQIKYQIGEGSEIDQLLAQWHADIIGLGELFDEKQVDTALSEMFRLNFKENMRGHYNTFRLFAVNDEAGAIICEWDKDAKKPAIPIPYAQESMHGFEYAFAGLLLSRGFIDEGLRVVKSVRDRYRGFNRNPWNEIECGSNYARSMASFALIPILSGMRADMTRGELSFKPILPGDFRSVWSVGDAWGNVQLGKESRLEIIDGGLRLKKLGLPVGGVKSVEVDGNPVGFRTENGFIVFDSEIAAKSSIIIK